MRPLTFFAGLIVFATLAVLLLLLPLAACGAWCDRRRRLARPKRPPSRLDVPMQYGTYHGQACLGVRTGPGHVVVILLTETGTKCPWADARN